METDDTCDCGDPVKGDALESAGDEVAYKQKVCRTMVLYAGFFTFVSSTLIR